MELDITRQPVSVYVDSLGDTATVSIVAEGDSVAYLWYKKDPSDADFSTIGSGISVTTTLSSSTNGRQLFCVVSDTNSNELESRIVAVAVKNPTNKVVVRGETIIDISADTVTASTLARGATAHGSDGNLIVGTGEGGGASAQGNATKGTDSQNRQTLTVTGLDFQPTGGSIMVYVDTGISGIDQVYGVYGVMRIASDWMFVCIEPTPSDGTSFHLRGTNDASPIGTVEILDDGIRATLTNANFQFIGPSNKWYYDLRG